MELVNRSGNCLVCFLAASAFFLFACNTPGKHYTRGEVAAPEPCVELAKPLPADPIPPVYRDKDLYRPISKADIRPLTLALEQVERADKTGHMIQLGQRAGPMSVERVNVLVQDVAAALARIHLEDMLGRIGGGPNPDAFFMEWGTGVAGFLDACGEMRYAEFGGLPTLESVNILIEDNRDILEPLIFDVLNPELPPGLDPDGRSVP